MGYTPFVFYCKVFEKLPGGSCLLTPLPPCVYLWFQGTKILVALQAIGTCVSGVRSFFNSQNLCFIENCLNSKRGLLLLPKFYTLSPSLSLSLSLSLSHSLTLSHLLTRFCLLTTLNLFLLFSFFPSRS